MYLTPLCQHFVYETLYKTYPDHLLATRHEVQMALTAPGHFYCLEFDSGNPHSALLQAVF